MALPPRWHIDPASMRSLLAWYDASDADTLFSDDDATIRSASGSAVAVWRDKSKNGLHLTQRVANNRPTYRAAAVNNRSAVEFDGTNDSLATRNASNALTYLIDLATTRSLSFVCVSIATSGNTLLPFSMKRINAPDYLSGFVFYTTTISNRFEHVFGSGVASGSVADYGSLSYSRTATAWHIASYSLTPSGGAARYGGAGAAMTNVSGSMTTANFLTKQSGQHNLAVGARGYDTSNSLLQFMKGQIAELLIFSGNLTNGELLPVEQYVAAKYGISLA